VNDSVCDRQRTDTNAGDFRFAQSRVDRTVSLVTSWRRVLRRLGSRVGLLLPCRVFARAVCCRFGGACWRSLLARRSRSSAIRVRGLRPLRASSARASSCRPRSLAARRVRACNRSLDSLSCSSVSTAGAVSFVRVPH